MGVARESVPASRNGLPPLEMLPADRPAPIEAWRSPHDTMTSTPAKEARTAPSLSIAQMLGVMRVEFHRSRTQRSPLCTLMVAVDGMSAIFE
jgi:hypothetical protein